jgi:hypothetical protein
MSGVIDGIGRSVRTEDVAHVVLDVSPSVGPKTIREVAREDCSGVGNS